MIFLFALVLPITWAVTPAPAPAASVYLPSQVKAGQKAYGLTVFQDERVERFELTLLGVLNNFLGPQKDLILAKLTDKRLEQAGVVAGMSGSPVYVDGKLLGALGYAMGTFMKDGICGITPIGAMREVEELPRVDPLAARPAEALTTPRGRPAAALAMGSEGRRALGAPFGEDIRPIAAPLSLAGVDPAIYAHFAKKFEDMGFVAAPGSASNEVKTTPRDLRSLEPGGAVSAQLVRGDMNIAATGTITWVDGKSVLAFGHPFMGLGATSFPMTKARIITIIASFQRSFKVGETLQEVGTFTQDRLTAIGGEIGAKSQLLPVTVDVTSLPEGKKHHFTYEVARDPRLTPDLVQLVVANSLARRTDSGLTGTVEIEGVVDLEGGTKLPLASIIAMEKDLTLPVIAALSVARPIDILWHNEFGGPLVKGVTLKAKLDREVRRLRADVLSMRGAPYAPGEKVHLRVGLRGDTEALVYRDLSFDVAANMEPGDYEVYVGGALEANGLEAKVGGVLRPQNSRGLVDAIRSIRQDGPLYLMVVGQGASLRVGEALLSDLPLSYAAQITPREGDQRSQRSGQTLLYEYHENLGAFVYGDAHATLRVRAPRQ